LVALVIAVAAFALVAVQRRVLTDGLDAGLRTRAASMATLLVGGSSLDATTGDNSDERFVQVVAEDGSVVASSPNLAGAAAVASAAAGPTLRTMTGLSIDDDAFRVLSTPSSTEVGTVTIHVGQSLEEVEESAAALGRSLLVAGPLLVMLMGVVVWWLVGRTLRPVENIRAEVMEIQARHLDRRVPVPQSSDEVARLAAAMNEMLDRLQNASDLQRRFLADASHELRGPLTRMRAELEVDVAHPSTADPWHTHRSVLDDLSGLQDLVEDLLQLARSDAGVSPLRRAEFDLADIAAEEAASFDDAIDLTKVESVIMAGDRDQLARALRNLLDNAVRHAESRVSVSVHRVDGRAVVAVADDGAGIQPGDRERVFERFTRLDEARSAKEGGAGLGLAIVRDIVGRHGGTIRIEDGAPGARFVLELPIVEADSEA